MNDDKRRDDEPTGDQTQPMEVPVDGPGGPERGAQEGEGSSSQDRPDDKK